MHSAVSVCYIHMCVPFWVLGAAVIKVVTYTHLYFCAAMKNQASAPARGPHAMQVRCPMHTLRALLTKQRPRDGSVEGLFTPAGCRPVMPFQHSYVSSAPDRSKTEFLLCPH